MSYREADLVMRSRVLVATSVSYVVVLLDTSIVNVALDRISTALATNIAGLQWIVNAYTLAFASLLLTGGTLGDRLGARKVYLFGLLTFTLASTVCGSAADLRSLIAARVLQGVGAAMLVPCSLKLINHACPEPEQRARAVGLWIGCGGVAMAAGPMIGGLLIQEFGWRSIFFVNMPIGLFGLVMTTRIELGASLPRGRPFDVVGQVSAIVTLSALIGVLIEGKTLGWSSPVILSGILVTLVAGTTFFMVEARSAHPMVPLSFFRSDVFSGSIYASMASAFVSYGLLFVVSLYFQQVRGYSPFSAGVALLPMTVMVAAGSMASSRVVKLFGMRWSMCLAFACYAAGALGLLAIKAASAYGVMVLPLFAIGLASGFISPAATAPAMGTIAKHDSGVAGAVLNVARQTGAALGVAIFGALVATLHPFEAGMRATLWAAAAMSLVAGVVWWISTSSIVGTGDPNPARSKAASKVGATGR